MYHHKQNMYNQAWQKIFNCFLLLILMSLYYSPTVNFHVFIFTNMTKDDNHYHEQDVLRKILYEMLTISKSIHHAKISCQIINAIFETSMSHKCCLPLFWLWHQIVNNILQLPLLFHVIVIINFTLLPMRRNCCQ